MNFSIEIVVVTVTFLEKVKSVFEGILQAKIKKCKIKKS